MSIIREGFISAPQITTAPSGVLDHATVIDSSGFGWRTEAGLFPSVNCLDTLVPTTICPEDPIVTKDFLEEDWAPGFNFSVYGGSLCRLVGYDRDRAREDLTRVFLANESKGVEKALMGTRFVANAPLWAAATDLTPASGAVSPTVGLALLEGFAGQVYAGVPTVLLPRTVASIVSDDFDWKANPFLSKIGSKIVNAAGLEPSTGPTGAAPAAGEYWLYATGEIVVERGEVVSREATDLVNNEQYILVERSYRAAVDCFTAAVRVEVFA